jgi:hypothetical protein
MFGFFHVSEEDAEVDDSRLIGFGKLNAPLVPVFTDHDGYV